MKISAFSAGLKRNKNVNFAGNNSQKNMLSKQSFKSANVASKSNSYEDLQTKYAVACIVIAKLNKEIAKSKQVCPQRPCCNNGRTTIILNA